jgi:peroxiredoxin
VPGYVENEATLRANKVDEVLVVCTNDGAVMSAWAEDQGVVNSKFVTFLADPNAELISALGMELTDPGPVSKLGPHRSKRFAAYVEDGVFKVFRSSEADDDPAGDGNPVGTCWEDMLVEINRVRKPEL